MTQLTQEEFETAIADALDSIPDDFLDAMDNVVIMAEDEPDGEDLRALDEEGNPAGVRSRDELLGIFVGSPITEKPFEGFEGELPDMVKIFKGPHERCYPNHDEALGQVRKTVIHEVGHFFGWDDDHMHALGY